MKNFRKVLALVLVIATLFSFAAIANASFADMDKDALAEYETPYYEDEAKVSAEYHEGVRVLTYAGILNGYEDGTYQPANSIRRNEMAKMIAVLANAGYDVEELYASASAFEDVPADDWAASYVAYCAHTGIVAGRSATSFDPNASVTGLETAKMLLVVLGFDAEKQGYVGADWKVNVLRDAKVMGLLEGFKASYDYNAAITREEAAHMMVNALKAPCVVGFLTDGSSVEVTNALVFGGWNEDDYDDYDIAKVGTYATLKDAAEAGDWSLYGDVVISNDILSEVLFDIYATEGTDCFGRPGTAWISLNGRKETVLGCFAYEADFASYNTDEDELEDFLYGYHKGEYEYVLTVNGEETKYDDLQDLVDDIAFGKGVVVEAYICEETIYVVVINTFIGEVTAVNMAKGTVTIGGENKSITVDNDWGFNASDVDETVVLFWICKDGVHDVEEIEPVTGTVTRADVDGKGNHSFVADGETYEYAATFGMFLGGEMIDEDMYNKDENGKFVSVGGDFYNNGNREHYIYTDKYGYVMYTEWVDNANTEIVVIDGDSWISKDRFETADGIDYEINTCDFVYFEEGAPIKTVDTTYDFNAGQIGGHGTDDDILAWVDYVDDDEITFAPAAVANKGKDTIYLAKGQVKIGSSNASHDVRDYLVNSNTQIIVRVPDYFGEEEDDFTYLYFDGINDIDANYKAEDFQYFLDNECDQDGSGRYYSHIYVDAAYAMETNRAFILRYAGASLLKLENGRVMGGSKYEAIVNGEEAIVVYENDDRATVNQQLNRNGKEIPVMIKSDLVLVGWTLDDMPVWADVRPDDETLTNAEDPDFLISGGVLSWNEGDETVVQWEGIRMDPDCAIWIATPNKKGEFEATLVSQEEFNDYRSDYGWDLVDGYCWAVDALDETNRTDGLYDYLLLVLVEAGEGNVGGNGTPIG